MKKKTILKVLAGLALGGTAALGLVFTGCGHDHTFDTSEWGGYDATGHWHLPTCGHDDEKGDFENHDFGENGQYCLDCGYANPDYVAPSVEGVYTITLVVGEDGALGTGTATTVKTENGKIKDYLPEPTAKKAHWKFDNWYDAEGKPIVEVANDSAEPTVFTADTTIYAKFVREDGIWNSDGSEFVGGLIQNTNAPGEYWLGVGKSLLLEVDDVVTVYMYGKQVSFNLDKNSVGVDKSVTDVKIDFATVTVEGKFKVYLRDNSTETNPDNWTCEFTGKSVTINKVSEIPEGCGTIQITADNGIVTIYLKDAFGRVVSAEEFKYFSLYTYEPEIFGDWNGSATNGALAAEMTGVGDITDETGFIFRFGSAQYDAIFNIEVGNTYYIDLSAATIEAALYTGPAIESRPGVSQGGFETFVLNGNYLAGTGFEGAAYAVKDGFYIDPVDGLTLTLPAGAKVQVVKCTDAVIGMVSNDGWIYGDAKHFSAIDGDTCIKFNGGEGTVMTGGEYKITVGGTDENPVFIFELIKAAEGGEDVTPPAEVVLYIRGAGKSPALDSWNATTALTRNDNIYTITLDLYKDDTFKFADANYSVEYGSDKVSGAEGIGGSGNIVCLANGNYTFTIDHKAGTVSVVRNGDIENPVEETVVHYYIKGAAVPTVGWNAPATEAYELKETGEGTGVYTMTINLIEGAFMFYSKNVGVETGTVTDGTAEIKADKIGEGKDYVSGTTGDITANAAGTYTFTFTASTNKLNVTFTPDSSESEGEASGDVSAE